MGADCKSVGLRLHWFESSTCHQRKRLNCGCVFPDDEDAGHEIRHLPEDVQDYFHGARRVLAAGVPTRLQSNSERR
jgi:hypothetical protein